MKRYTQDSALQKFVIVPILQNSKSENLLLLNYAINFPERKHEENKPKKTIILNLLPLECKESKC